MSEMTASEAREAADYYRKQADLLDSRVRGPFTFVGSDATMQSWAARNEAYNEQMARRTRAAAVALEAYADGIDAAAREREACAATLDEQAARLCDAAMQCDRVIGYGSREGSAYLDKAKLAEDLARAIRARGAK